MHIETQKKTYRKMWVLMGGHYNTDFKERDFCDRHNVLSGSVKCISLWMM